MTLVKCDICQKPISIYFPLHKCQPTLAQLIRLIPNYKNMLPDEQARWIESVVHALGQQHKPNWYEEHSKVLDKLIKKYGKHLIEPSVE